MKFLIKFIDPRTNQEVAMPCSDKATIQFLLEITDMVWIVI